MISLISRQFALFALMLVMSVGAVWAQPTNGRGGGNPGTNADGQNFDQCLGRLELTAEQRTAISALMEDAAAFNRATMQQIEELSRELRAAREAGDRVAIARIEAAIAEKKHSLEAAHERLNNAIVGNLTDRQAHALRECMQGDDGGGTPPPPPSKGHSLEDCLRAVRLTDAQAAQIGQMREAAGAEMRQTMQEIEELSRMLRAAHEAGNREQAARIEAAIRAKKESLAALQERLNHAIMDVLTAEQLATLRRCMSDEGGNGGGGTPPPPPPPGRGDDHRKNSFEDCLSKIELTREQAARIAELKGAAAGTIRELNQSLEELMRALHAAREEGDREAVARIEAAIKDKKEAIAAAMERLNHAIVGVLTPEQQAELRDCMTHDNNGKGRGPGDRDEDRSHRKDCLTRILTAEQEAQVRALNEQYRETNHDLMQEIRELHAALRTALHEHNADEVARLRRAIRTKMAELKSAQEQLRADVLALLTDEQRQALEDCLDGREDHRGDRGPGLMNPVAPDLK